jgi:hypothetical protein
LVLLASLLALLESSGWTAQALLSAGLWLILHFGCPPINVIV